MNIRLVRTSKADLDRQVHALEKVLALSNKTAEKAVFSCPLYPVTSDTTSPPEPRGGVS